MTRVLCARFPHLGLVAAWRRHPELRAEPVVVGGRPELRLPVLAASEAAQAAGVRSGQPLREAQQRCPTAAFVAVDAAAVAALREELLARLLTVAPAVEVGDDEVFADLGGRHVSHADEPAWAAAVARTLAAALDDVAPAVGVAGSRFVARMAARVSAPRRVRRVPAGTEAAFLAALPVSVLPAPAPVVARLLALGLDCLGAVAGLSPADLERQFGPTGRVLHRLARGLDDQTLSPHRAPRTLAERLVLDGGVLDLEVIQAVARRCTEALGARLRELGLAAGELALVVELEGEPGQRLARVTPAPAGSGAELWPSVLGLLAGAALGAPVLALTLEAGALAGGVGRQVDLLREGDASRDAMARTVARLHDRFGAGTVVRPALAVDPGDLPERRFAWEAPTLSAAPVRGTPTRSRRVPGGTAGHAVRRPHPVAGTAPP